MPSRHCSLRLASEILPPDWTWTGILHRYREKPCPRCIDHHRQQNTSDYDLRKEAGDERFPFNNRAIEALPAHDIDSPSMEAEYNDMEWIVLYLRVAKNDR